MIGEKHPSRTRTPVKNKAIASGHLSEGRPALSPISDSGRPRTPGSVSAVKHGRSLLSTFRNNKRRNLDVSGRGTTSGASAVPVPHINTNGSTAPSAGEYSGDRRFQPRAGGLARNLEAALHASLADQGSSAKKDHGRVCVRSGDDSAGAGSNGEASNNKSDQGTLGNGSDAHAAWSSGGGGQGDTSERNGADSAATATAFASTAVRVAADGDDATAASKSSPPRKDSNASTEGSPARLTPEMVRQEARTSQAAFLSSVLSTEDFDTAKSLPRLSPPVTPNGLHRSPADSTGPRQPDGPVRPVSGGISGTGVAVSSGDAMGSSNSDKDAVARWVSMQRLHTQSFGLGSAAAHQLTRALQLCRDLRGLKTGIGGGVLSGHERASRLDALQSTLHGLEEVLSKRSLVDRSARVEAEALGGPAVVEGLLEGDPNGSVCDQIQIASADLETATVKMTAVGRGEGWLTGSQLKAFEKSVQTRSSMEISALESERRKLRSKVEMFQRQVQLLQRDGVDQSPILANGIMSEIGGTADAASGERSVGGGLGSSDGEKRFADLLDARLGEERHVQATLKAELASLRGSLEEKDGLIGALREALRSAATPARRGDATSVETNAPVNPEHGTAGADKATETAPKPSPADGRAVVPGRGVFAPRSSDNKRSRGSYGSRSSRFLGAQGPEAATGAAPGAVVQRGGPWSGSSSGLGRRYASKDELRRAEDVRWGGSIGDDDNEDGDTDSVVSAGSGGGGASATAGSSSTSATMAADSDAASPHGNGGEYANAATKLVRNGSDGGLSGRRAGPRSLVRREGNADMVHQAASATSKALRILWNSVRVVGSRAGLQVDGGDSVPVSPKNASQHRGTSSHAVLIL